MLVGVRVMQVPTEPEAVCGSRISGKGDIGTGDRGTHVVSNGVPKYIWYIPATWMHGNGVDDTASLSTFIRWP